MLTQRNDNAGAPAGSGLAQSNIPGGEDPLARQMADVRRLIYMTISRIRVVNSVLWKAQAPSQCPAVFATTWIGATAVTGHTSGYMASVG